MSGVDLVIGAPAWDRAWALPLWFESLRANVDPARTGLVFSVPSTDTPTREAIAGLSEGFAWVEVLRDRGVQLGRDERPESGHETLAQARNQILHTVSAVRPPHYLSWDTDFLVPPGTVERLIEQGVSLITVWAWLNRQPPKLINHFDGQEYRQVRWQQPIRATAMAWDKQHPQRAVHYPAEQFNARAHRTWRCGVTLAFQLMDPRAYGVSSYAPHHDGEDIPFNWQLHQRGVERWCCGDIVGVHLYDRHAKSEIQMGWPDVLDLADQRPLAAAWTGERPIQYEAYGFFPVTRSGDDSGAKAA